jgi:hypothetical protein
MKLIKNTGSQRVVDELRHSLPPSSSLALASPAFSLFAFAELRELLETLDSCRIVLPAIDQDDLGLTGSDADLPLGASRATAFTGHERGLLTRLNLSVDRIRAAAISDSECAELTFHAGYLKS